MPEDLGMSAVADDASIAVDETADTEVIADGSESVEGSETETPAEIHPAVKTPVSLDSLAKTHKDALKAIDPGLPGKIRDAVFAQQALTREFPGGLKEAISARDTLNELGGTEGIEEARAALGDYGKLESQFEKADPAFIQSLAKEGPQAFSALMPTGIEEWKRVDPERYTHTMAKVMVNTLDQHNVSQQLAAIWKATEKPELKTAIEEIWQTIEGYRTAASKEPEKRVDPNAERLTQREQEIAEREQKLVLAPAQAVGEAKIKSVAEREMMQSYQWDQTDPDVKQAVIERIRTELGKQLGKNPAYTGPRDRMKAAGNIEGLKKHIEQNFERALTGPKGVIQRVARLFNVKPKNAGTVVKKPAVVAGVKAPEQGWARVAKMPALTEIDRTKTTEDMAYEGKAILKSGRKVQWA